MFKMKTTKKSTVDIFAFVDLSLLALWLISLLASKTEIEAFSVIFLFSYIAAIIVAVIFTVVSVAAAVKKKPFSKPLVVTTYIVNAVWVFILICVLKNITPVFTALL